MTLPGVGDLLQYRDIVQERGDLEVPVIAEFLRQVAQAAADLHPLGRVGWIEAEHAEPPGIG